MTPGRVHTLLLLGCALAVTSALPAPTLRAHVPKPAIAPPEPGGATRPAESPATTREDEPPGDDGAPAEDEGWLPGFDGLTVHARRPVTAASQRSVRDRDFLLHPRQTPSDLMAMVPHLHISQHSGGGKGHQIFLRGFDAEHGDDVGAYLEGVPLNEPSHAHGIGYLDLHFLIPEAVERMEILKGPYEPGYGDFSTAGTVDFRIRDRVDESSVELKAGSFATYQVTALTSLPTDEVDTLLALQGTTTEGFTAASEWKAFRAIGSVGVPLFGGGHVRALYTGYGSDWYAPDTVPQAAVDDGAIGFYGAVDETDGGAATRHGLSLHATLPGEDGAGFTARAWLVKRRTRIWSNYTYWLEDRERGDQTEQADDRWTYGFSGEALLVHRLGPVRLETTLGGLARGDTVRLEVWRTTRRERWDSAAGFDIQTADLAAFGRLEVIPTDWFRAIAGVRVDYLLFDVRGAQDFRRPSGAWDEDRRIDGAAGRLVPQPKGTLVFSPTRDLDLFLNFGVGFHSPDARDPVRNPDMDVPLAYVGEVGARTRLWDRLDVGAAVWLAYLEQEVFFDPLQGRSVDQGASRRFGADLELRLEILSWLWTALDVGFADARLTAADGGWWGDEIPGSPRWMGRFALLVRHPVGLHAGLRVRYVGARALDQGQRGEAAWLVDLLAEYRWRFLAVGLSIENLIDLEWQDSQFWYASRFDPEDGGDPAPGRHFTAGTPIAVRGWLRAYF